MKCFKCNQGELEVIKENGKNYVRCNKCGSVFTTNDLQNRLQQQSSQRTQVTIETDEDEEYEDYSLGKIATISGWILCALFLLFGLSGGGFSLLMFLVAAVLISPAFRNRVYLSGKVWIPLVIVLFIAGIAVYPETDPSSKQIAKKQEAPASTPKEIKASTGDQDKKDPEPEKAEKEEQERAAQEQAKREEQERIAQEQAEQERIAQEQAAQAEQERIAQEQAEQERIAQEQAAAAQAEQERISQEQAAAAQAEQERIAQEQAAAQQAEQERIAQEQAEQQRIAQEQAAAQANVDPQPPAEGMVWVTETGSKYHNTNNCGNTNSTRARQVPLSQAQQAGLGPCKKCYN